MYPRAKQEGFCVVIWNYGEKYTTFAVTKLACGFVVYDSALRGEIWLF